MKGEESGMSYAYSIFLILSLSKDARVPMQCLSIE